MHALEGTYCEYWAVRPVGGRRRYQWATVGASVHGSVLRACLPQPPLVPRGVPRGCRRSTAPHGFGNKRHWSGFTERLLAVRSVSPPCRQVYLPKEFVVLEGDRGHHMYILIRGVCEVSPQLRRSRSDRRALPDRRMAPCRRGTMTSCQKAHDIMPKGHNGIMPKGHAACNPSVYP